MTPPTFQDILKAKRVVGRYLRSTPLFHYPSLDLMLNCQVWVKHENHQPVGAFKVRGGINLISQLNKDERRSGVIAASTGNHGLSVAYASRLFGVRAIIGMPEAANPIKVEAIRNLGAEIIFHGRDFDEAREYVEGLASRCGYRYIHSGNEPLLLSGVATETLEILEEQPDLDMILIPIGGGSGAAGACLVAKAINPNIKVIGVQSSAAPAAYLSWKERRLMESTMGTFAEGLATRTAFSLPQRVLWQYLDNFILVSDEAIRQAIVLMIEKTHNLVEGAGAAPLAAALQLGNQLAGCKVALIASGGNISPQTLKAVLAC
jgi:threonine dehydratase